MLIIATVFILLLLSSALNGLTPSRTALPDESKPTVYRFKKLGIYLTVFLVIRTVCALFLTDDGVDFEVEGFLQTTFKLSRNDLLPSVLIAFAGFFLIKIIYSKNEKFLSTSKVSEETASADEASADASTPTDSTPAPVANNDSPAIAEPVQNAPVQEDSSSEEKPMFCRFCGKKITAGSAFCPFCGQKL